MTKIQIDSHGSDSTDRQLTCLDNLVNANSGDHVYVYRDGDQLAVENAIQTARFHLDDIITIYEGDIDVFRLVFEGDGEILEFWWTESGFSMIIADGLSRHEVQFILRHQAGENR